MENIRKLMATDHRQCDDCFVAVEQAIADASWGPAEVAFKRFQEAMLRHFDAEESILFPAFETHTGMSMGPTQVMRGEHQQMRELLKAAGVALNERDADDYSGNAETLLIMMQQHNMKEENILYPMSDQHLAHQLAELLPQLKSRIAGEVGGAMSETGAERLIDGRAMEPPEPFVQTMEALDVIEPGQTLLLLLAREPFPLYRALELNGIAWATRRNADGDFEIRMWRKDSAPLVVPTGVDCPDCAGQ